MDHSSSDSMNFQVCNEEDEEYEAAKYRLFGLKILNLYIVTYINFISWSAPIRYELVFLLYYLPFLFLIVTQRLIAHVMANVSDKIVTITNDQANRFDKIVVNIFVLI